MSILEDWDDYGNTSQDRYSSERIPTQVPGRPTKTQSLYDKISTNKRQQNSFRFPSNLGYEGSDNVMRFNVNVPSGSKYLGGVGGNAVLDANGNQISSVRRERNSDSGSLASRFSQNSVRTDTVIDLFLPPSIQTQYSSAWKTENLGMTGAALEAAYGLGQGGWTEQQGTLDTIKNTMATAVPSIASKAFDLITRSNTESVRQMVTGTVANPYMEVMFEGINSRAFNFTFKMIPRNSDEQYTIRDIVKQFKFHQAPEVRYAGQSNYWLFPSEFDITFLYKGAENPWVHRISTCALTDVQVEYTAEGQYTSHKDGSPFSTTLTLSFTEMEVLTKELIMEGY